MMIGDKSLLGKNDGINMVGLMRRAFLKTRMIFSFMGLLSLLLTVPAQSQAGVADVLSPPTDIAIVGTALLSAAEFVWDQVEELIHLAETSVQKALSMVLEQLDNAMKYLKMQANADSNQLESNRRVLTPQTMETYTMVPTTTPTGGTMDIGSSSFAAPSGGSATITYGNNHCNSSNSVAQTANVGESMLALAAALQNLTQPAKSGADMRGNAAQADLLDECRWGFRDTNDPAIHGVCSGVTSTQSFGNYVNADLQARTIFASRQYSIPKATKVSSGNVPMLVLPTPSAVVNTDEMNFVAAVYACKRFRPRSALPVTNATPTANSADAIEARLNDSASSNGVNDQCILEIAKRVRISSALASAASCSTSGSSTPSVICLAFAAEQNACIAMANHGDISQADYTECTQNGRSWLQMQKDIACRHGQMGTATTTIGTSAPSTGSGSQAPSYIELRAHEGSTTAALSRDINNHYGDCAMYLANEAREQQSIISSMQSALQESQERCSPDGGTARPTPPPAN